MGVEAANITLLCIFFICLFPHGLIPDFGRAFHGPGKMIGHCPGLYELCLDRMPFPLLAALFASMVFRVKLRIIFFPAFVNPEPLVGIPTNRAFHGIGDHLGIDLDVGAQISETFESQGFFDMDNQLPGGFPDTENRQNRTFTTKAQKGRRRCGRNPVAKKMDINTFFMSALINQKRNCLAVPQGPPHVRQCSFFVDNVNAESCA
jgi:hypothetical protein